MSVLLSALLLVALILLFTQRKKLKAKEQEVDQAKQAAASREAQLSRNLIN